MIMSGQVGLLQKMKASLQQTQDEASQESLEEKVELDFIFHLLMKEEEKRKQEQPVVGPDMIGHTFSRIVVQPFLQTHCGFVLEKNIGSNSGRGPPGHPTLMSRNFWGHHPTELHLWSNRLPTRL